MSLSVAEPPSTDAPAAARACANCGAALAGRFCHACGQEDGPGPGGAGFLRKVLADAASIDGKALRSLRDLVLRPGFLTREYMEGRRVRYTEPAQLYLLAAALFFLVNAYRPFITVDLATHQVVSSLNALAVNLTIAPSLEASLRASGTSMEVYRERFENLASGCLPPLLLGSVLLFAGLMRLIERRAPRGVHLVFALHWSAFFLLLMIVNRLLPEQTSGRGPLGAVIAVIGLIYLALAVRRVYGRGWAGSVLSAIGLKAAFYVLLGGWMLAAMSVAFALA
ncbi:MAG TPA: DUF3667 domain-containing protein [Longimicrobiaceae bacterium]|nr:DUF3667 domain-containing protein [Longimicrobiaceae bacterium]